ncbi:peptidoglycan editing factor PgeF [Candidatus Falkowbacteria bacterium CG10_big_fil_rev_8_21_14_0_10_39_11]|uniref:Purine nucleoside phosphorylase n=1 Tax=Candidatus Falkowbacteria bacterium CG10_big_fil_rev_8_21_14_0_10_39_11 TaxID=1974565 RepID=A0A2H0V5N4_9BACT|nr:MAG: peptidoglycan editing factor PgeF [Candidatus Falkowbacteria bacterium CG10_big_fil_rev_8_21_14_0_10_39_11]
MIRYFKAWPGLQAAISEKRDGNLSFKWTGGDVVKNRQYFFSSLNINLEQMVAVDQIHGNHVVVVGSGDMGAGAWEKDWLRGYDGLVTKETGVALVVESADCVPIMFYDPRVGIVGAAHAGWRGVVSNISEKMVEHMNELGSDKAKILVEIGPHIGSCCFEIREDILNQFEAYPDCVQMNSSLIRVDLTKIIKKQLIGAGIEVSNVGGQKHCTRCEHNFYSYRQSNTNLDGAMLSVIMRV